MLIKELLDLYSMMEQHKKDQLQKIIPEIENP